jgi:nicotianamine synthase
LLLQRHFPGVTIANVDCNIQALAASKTLTSRLGISSRIECVHGDASSVPVSVLAISDVVYLAALVGLSSGDKSAILSSVVFKLKDGAVLVARSADGLRGLLYPVLDIDGLNLRQLGLELVTEWVPEDGEIVNSVVMFRKVSSQ